MLRTSGTSKWGTLWGKDCFQTFLLPLGSPQKHGPNIPLAQFRSFCQNAFPSCFCMQHIRSPHPCGNKSGSGRSSDGERMANIQNCSQHSAAPAPSTFMRGLLYHEHCSKGTVQGTILLHTVAEVYKTATSLRKHGQVTAAFVSAWPNCRNWIWSSLVTCLPLPFVCMSSASDSVCWYQAVLNSLRLMCFGGPARATGKPKANQWSFASPVL